jgi:hypothetical protein
MRMTADHRRKMIVENAKQLAMRIGLKELTFYNVASECPIETSGATVRYHMGNRLDLWTEASRGCPELAEEAKALGITND